jgi:hypothetical protein
MATSQRKFIRRLRTVYGLDVRTRKQWGSTLGWRYAQRLVTHRAHVPADTVVAHITVTFDDGVLTGEFDADMREIERIGHARFGSGISYNFGVDKATGMVGIGQPLRAKGTHTVNDKNRTGFSQDQNYWARAIAWIGVPGNLPSPKCIDAYVAIIACLMDCGHVTEDPDVLPHSFFAYKDCPMPIMAGKLPEIKRRAQALHQKNKNTPTPRRAV